MPGIDGFKLAQILKSSEKLKFVPVILVSGKEFSHLTEQQKLERAVELGVEKVISKPFSISELVQAAKELVINHPLPTDPPLG